jgi:hypothetical protein
MEHRLIDIELLELGFLHEGRFISTSDLHKIRKEFETNNKINKSKNLDPKIFLPCPIMLYKEEHLVIPYTLYQSIKQRKKQSVGIGKRVNASDGRRPQRLRFTDIQFNEVENNSEVLILERKGDIICIPQCKVSFFIVLPSHGPFDKYEDINR